MRKIRDVLHYRHSAGLSLDAIARALNLSKGVVAKYLRLALAAGLGWPLPEDLDDSGLEKLLYRQGVAREPTYAEPDYAAVHQELKKKGVTLTLLWEEYRQAVGGRGYQYTAFCTRYKDWTGQLKRSMRQIHRAGEKLCTDGSGALAAAARQLGVEHHAINLSAGIRVNGAWHIQNVNAYHSRLKTWVRKFNGVATRYLANYLGWFRTIDRESAFGLKPSQWLALAMGRLA